MIVFRKACLCSIFLSLLLSVGSFDKPQPAYQYFGCFSSFDGEFENIYIRNTTVSVLISITKLTADQCWEYCTFNNPVPGNRNSFTFMALQSQMYKCFCFNDLYEYHKELLTVDPCNTQCTVEGQFCNINTMKVYTVCQQGTAAPPYCAQSCILCPNFRKLGAFCHFNASCFTCYDVQSPNSGCLPPRIRSVSLKPNILGEGTYTMTDLQTYYGNAVHNGDAFFFFNLQVPSSDSHVYMLEYVRVLHQDTGRFVVAFFEVGKQVDPKSGDAYVWHSYPQFYSGTGVETIAAVNNSLIYDHPNFLNMKILKPLTSLGVYYESWMADLNSTERAKHGFIYANTKTVTDAENFYIARATVFTPPGSKTFSFGYYIPSMEYHKPGFSDDVYSYNAAIEVSLREMCSLNMHCENRLCDTSDTTICLNGLCQPGYLGPRCIQLCTRGTFGRMCKQTCSGTCMNQNCDPVTGLCSDGCQPNWFGPYCTETTCPYGSYGLDCINLCSPHCFSSGVCNSVNGTCKGGCSPGFSPPLCKTGCMSGFFGANCTSVCGLCANGATCDATIGTCPKGICSGNQTSPYCMCPSGYYGPGCTKMCGACYNPLNCDSYLGRCQVITSDGGSSFDGPGVYCKTGWQPPQCKCAIGYYGDKCNQLCGKCKYNLCMQANGQCLDGCASGFIGSNCLSSCVPYFYGDNCQLHCGACLDNRTCNVSTGICDKGCQSGYEPPRCLHCNVGQYGPACSLKCGNCLLSGCDDRGYCEGGLCETGYEAPQCLCAAGTYGKNCDKRCGHCRDSFGCLLDGTCIYGCDPGYTKQYCTELCPAGYHGFTCSRNCGWCFNASSCDPVTGQCPGACDGNYAPPYCTCLLGFHLGDGDYCVPCAYCINGSNCDSVNGTCSLGCEAGFRPPLCNCGSHYYGKNCDLPCGHCDGQASCDITDGTCPGQCEYGYKPPMCKDTCDDFTYGLNCKSTCGMCLNRKPCDPVNGVCLDGCEPGYQPPTCSGRCPFGKYGQNCQLNCGSCFQLATCRDTDGKCVIGCEAGYQPPMCTDLCPIGTWGYGCVNKCGNCNLDTFVLSSSPSCDKVTGMCTNGCAGNYTLPLCVNVQPTTKTCPNNFYGADCKIPCGKCVNSLCDEKSGLCQFGCLAGYIPLYCIQECPNGHYGLNCAYLCGHCKDQFEVCRKTDGMCTSGCQSGWVGIACNTQNTAANTQPKLGR